MVFSDIQTFMKSNADYLQVPLTILPKAVLQANKLYLELALIEDDFDGQVGDELNERLQEILTENFRYARGINVIVRKDTPVLLKYRNRYCTPKALQELGLVQYPGYNLSMDQS